jgi:hypothetical protein
MVVGEVRTKPENQVLKIAGSSWISVTITQVRWFPSSSLGTDTTKLQLRVIFHDDSIA